ncbi:nitronate monooxygenase [Rossellomorea marisflavi]|uniref:nitronate monooxygenase n=1 Tax=Rossellomorea marisflavi TaxID=189381 RepID=UPI001318920B|nr:nitronate monooxygenase [Rossellomorea marisflavi]QHA36465.1 nitronate monooxygenase [Rossellomorea marisflavi]
MNRLMHMLQVEKPIIQAPMAGEITTIELVKASMNEGILGSLASGYLSPGVLEEQILAVSRHSRHPFQVNLFVPHEGAPPTFMHVEKWKERIPYSEEAEPFTTLDEQWDDFNRKVDLIIKHHVPMCSFTFHVPPEKIVKQLKQAGCLLMGTASTPEEAILMEEAGMDMVCVQGSEAGGHRASFLETDGDSSIGLMSLIPETVDAVSIPVIAAGGIKDRRAVEAAFILGACGVQVGTPFLLCKESGTPLPHRQRIMEAHSTDTRITSLFSGKQARGIVNRWMLDQEKYEKSSLPYPYQNTLTKPMRKVASESCDPSFMSLWAGQGIGSMKSNTTVREVVYSLWDHEIKR